VHHVVEELVARRPFYGPGAEPLSWLEDLLHPHVPDALAIEPREILAGVGETVDVVDAQALDDAVAHELECLGMNRREHRLVFDSHAREVADVEEAPVQAGTRVEVEERAAQVWIGPERVLVARGHVVRDDVQHHAEPLPRERAQFLLPAERVRDTARVHDVVAVRRALSRLERR
jgi:hypothetical protein